MKARRREVGEERMRYYREARPKDRSPIARRRGFVCRVKWPSEDRYYTSNPTLFFWRALPGRPCAARLVAGASGGDRAWAPRPMISHRHALSRVVGWAPCSEASHLARSRQRGVEKSNLDHRHLRHDWRSGQGLQLPVGLAQALEARKSRSGPPPRRFASRYTTSGWEVVAQQIVGQRRVKWQRGAIRA